MSYQKVLLDDRNEPTRLIFTSGEDGPSLTEDQSKILNRIYDEQQAITNIFSDEAKIRVNLFKRLKEICESCLIGRKYDSTQVDRDFDLLQEEILKEGAVVRRKYVSSIAVAGLIVLIAGFVFLAGYFGFKGRIEEISDSWANTLTRQDIEIAIRLVGALGFCCVGLFLGVLLATIFESQTENMKSIGVSRRRNISSTQKILIISVIMIVLLVLLFAGLIQVGVGNVLLNEMVDFESLEDSKPAVGLIAGLLCGFAEPKVSDLIATVLIPKRPDTGSSPRTDP